MPTDGTPDRPPEKPLNDHQFETPVVHESRSCGLTPEEAHLKAEDRRRVGRGGSVSSRISRPSP